MQGTSAWLLAALYGLAVTTDLVDGYLARRFESTSYFGRVLDLVGDKVLTVVSVMYAAARGVDVVPAATLAVREILMIGLRLVTVDGRQLLPTSRRFGGVLALLTWLNTLCLVLSPTVVPATVAAVYWICAALAVVNVCWRLYVKRGAIRALLSGEELRP